MKHHKFQPNTKKKIILLINYNLEILPWRSKKKLRHNKLVQVFCREIVEGKGEDAKKEESLLILYDRNSFPLSYQNYKSGKKYS